MKHDEQRVLDILKEKEMHGYEIAVRLNSDPEKSFEYRIGTLYPKTELTTAVVFCYNESVGGPRGPSFFLLFFCFRDKIYTNKYSGGEGRGKS